MKVAIGEEREAPAERGREVRFLSKARTKTSLERLLARTTNFAEDFARLGLSEEELQEACHLYELRLAELWRLAPSKLKRPTTMTVEDVDIVMRQLRVFVSTRFIRSLFIEADENGDGQVDQEEFLMMVAKLRGRRPLSADFYMRTLTREVTQRAAQVFRIADEDQDGFVDEQGLLAALKHLSAPLSTNSEEFKLLMSKLGSGASRRYSLQDVCILQAKLVRPPPAVSAALLSLSEEEVQVYERAFEDWQRAKNGAPGGLQDLCSLLRQLGHPASLDQVKQLLEELDVDRVANMKPVHLMYILVNLGAGTETRIRRIAQPGTSYEEARRLGFQLEELWDMGFDDLEQIRKAGWTAQQVRRAGIADPGDMRQAGYSAGELRKLGVDAWSMRLAGYSWDDLRNAGFSAEVLRECAGAEAKGKLAA